MTGSGQTAILMRRLLVNIRNNYMKILLKLKSSDLKILEKISKEFELVQLKKNKKIGLYYMYVDQIEFRTCFVPYIYRYSHQLRIQIRNTYNALVNYRSRMRELKGIKK